MHFHDLHFNGCSMCADFQDFISSVRALERGGQRDERSESLVIVYRTSVTFTVSVVATLWTVTMSDTTLKK
jgi:hypothetical protein